MGSESVSRFMFLLVLTAHGWFLRPRAFPLAREGDKPSVSPAKMWRRIYGFIRQFQDEPDPF